jgi:hypothetical protein
VGEWDVDGMLAAMPSALYSEWLAYAELEQFGDPALQVESRRQDWRAAMLAATLANVNRGPKQKAFDVADFLPHWEPGPAPAVEPPEDPERQAQRLWGIVEMWHAALGGELKVQ